MARTISPLFPATAELLRQLGERLRLARLRRRLSAKQVAARAGMAPMTLRSVERGGSGVTMGAYAAVMQVLGVERDFDVLAKADPLGRALQDARLSTKVGALPKAPAQRALEASKPLKRQRDARTSAGKLRSHTIKGSKDHIQEGRFSSARALAALFDDPRPRGPMRR